MIARGFKPVGWVAAVAGAALGCYMLSLNVAAERAELVSVERQIVMAKQDIRSLQTELGTRGRLSQLEHWNAEVLALSAPSSAQYLDNALTLARFDQREKTIEERATVRLASAEASPLGKAEPTLKAPARKLAPADYAAAAALAEKEPQPLVRRASYAIIDGKPVAPVRRATLIDSKLVAGIGAADRAGQADGDSGGQ